MESVGVSCARRRPLDVVFKDLNLDIGEKPVLQHISGECRAGELLAVMGPSGSGKTTLLNVLGGRVCGSGGVVQVGGEELTKTHSRHIAYVLQQDIFFSCLTLRQTLTYAALLHMPDNMSYQDKIAHVDYIIDLLDLRRCQHTIIGDVMKRGLSGGEKKRTNIACELLTNPSVMLIDEPTSGLDSSTALSLMRTLKGLAEKENKTVIVTLHQPSLNIFYMCDKLLLLCEGQSAYFGEISKVVDHFASIGLSINPHYNPADVILEHVRGSPDIRSRLIEAASKTWNPSYSQRISPSLHSLNNNNDPDVNKEKGQHDSGCSSHNSLSCDSINITSSNCTDCIELKNISSSKEIGAKVSTNDIHVDLEQMNSACDPSINASTNELTSSENDFANVQRIKTSKDATCDEELTHTSKWKTSFLTQVKVLTQRNFLVAAPSRLATRHWIQTLVLALLAGLTWFNIGRTEAELSDIQGWMFFSNTYWMMQLLFQALWSFPSERAIIMKERASGSYRVSAYYLAKMIGELPVTVTLPTVYLLISYTLMTWINVNIYVLLIHLGMLLLNAIVAQSVGLLIGAVVMDLHVGMTVSALFALFSQLFGGYLATRIPPWLTWAKYLSIIHYAFQNMNNIEFQYGSEVRCLESNSRFLSCNGSNEYIPVSDILSEREEYQPIWLNTAVLVLYLCLVRILTYLVLRFVHSPWKGQRGAKETKKQSKINLKATKANIDSQNTYKSK